MHEKSSVGRASSINNTRKSITLTHPVLTPSEANSRKDSTEVVEYEEDFDMPMNKFINLDLLEARIVQPKDMKKSHES